MRTVRGDLVKLALDGHFDVIVHGCNCFTTMGAGIARVIREVFPEAYAADRATLRGAGSKLGTFSHATVTRQGYDLTIVNAYTQFHFAGPGVLADYDAIRRAFEGIRVAFPGMRIGYPKIGAGLARGDWPTIAAIIDETLAGADHTFVELPAPR